MNAIYKQKDYNSQLCAKEKLKFEIWNSNGTAALFHRSTQKIPSPMNSQNFKSISEAMHNSMIVWFKRSTFELFIRMQCSANECFFYRIVACLHCKDRISSTRKNTTTTKCIPICGNIKTVETKLNKAAIDT